MESDPNIPPQHKLIGCTTECAHQLAFPFEKLFSISIPETIGHPELIGTVPFHKHPHRTGGALGTRENNQLQSGKEKVPQHVPQPVAAATCGKYVALPEKLKVKLRASTATTT
jgi:hypothetical protein